MNSNKSTTFDREKHRAWVKWVAESVRGLPQLPTLVAKLLELIDDPSTNARTLGKLISTDQVLASRILRYANSAFYGFTRRISTLDLAVVVLGFDTIKEICLGVTMHNLLGREQDDTTFDMSRFWEHCVSCSVACRMMARKRFPRISGEVFVAGLIHDIGKLVLKQHLKKEFKQILEEVRSTGCLFSEAERRLFGLTHATIGMWLAKHWNLPNQLIEAVGYHHRPEKSKEYFTHTAIVHFADYLTRVSDIGNSGDDVIPSLNEKVADFLRLRRNKDNSIELEYYKRVLMDELEKAETFLNVIQGAEVENYSAFGSNREIRNGRIHKTKRVPQTT